MRVGSNSTRQIIYVETIHAWKQHKFIGSGIKAIGSLGYPLGSHSSYLGFLYKTGIVGFICVIIGFGVKCRKLVIHLKGLDTFCATCIMAVLSLLIFFIFEDIDGSNWLVCVWMAMLGIISNQENEIKE